VPGTFICLIRARSGSVATDWIWDIWRELGNSLPEQLDVAVDRTDLRLRFRVPEQAEGVHGEGYKALTSKEIVGTAVEVIGQVAQWSALADATRKNRTQFELTWRRDNVLDWVCYDKDIEGEKRDWAVMSGYALRRVRISTPHPLEHY
jgi:hypothetical protein